MSMPANSVRGTKRRVVLWTLVALGIIVFGSLAYRISSLGRDAAIAEFFASNAAEDQLMDPLILGGRGVVAQLIKEVVKKDMPRRRYAILALGNIGDPAAIETLNLIALDPSEVEYVRCDALTSIALIDENRAKTLAERAVPNGADCIKKAASVRRSYWAALLGLHW
ncbi:MAG TPA: hypothetical protein VFB20_08200 [Burkholderiales bacterium]|nr:hypothetical protein [Burkholderiales bacterium]